MKKVIVIGAGASGMMAAIGAAEKGAEVVLLEKNEQAGKKILITGKGRCNVTNNKDMEQFIQCYAHNGKFLYTAFHTLSNQAVKDFFEQMGVPLKIERGERVFPVSDQAKDIVKALNKRLRQLNVTVKVNSPVKALLFQEEKVIGVVLNSGDKLYSDSVVVAVGGASYQATGSSGDGYKWVKSAGHSLTEIRPALVPLESPQENIRALQGLSLKNVTLTLVTKQGKKLGDDFGEMIFTHFGISGPIVLTLSSKAVDYWQKNDQPLQAIIDLKPALSEEQLNDRLLREIDQGHNKQLKTMMGNLLPQKLISVFLDYVALKPELVLHQLQKSQRQSIIKGLKQFTFMLSRPRPLNEAIVTAGGVTVKEISPQTMASKLIDGLYFAGEIIDVDGFTGGFNLQAAFSTGYLAGVNSAKDTV